MEDSSKEQQPRCSCGFWGSHQTLGLCSKCYREAQKNQSQNNSGSSKHPSASSSKSSLRGYHSPPLPGGESTPVGRMDSKHFPSHSTTDNLPSSLSSPGERTPALANPPTSVATTSAIAAGVATSSTNTPSTSSHHLQAVIASTAAGEMPGASSSTTQLSATQSESSTSTATVSSDPTIDSRFDLESSLSASSSDVSSCPSSIGLGQFFPSPSISSEVITDTANESGSTGRPVDSNSVAANTRSHLVAGSCKDSSSVVADATLAVSSTKDISVKCEEKQQTDCPKVQDKQNSIVSGDKTNEQSPSKGVKRSRDEMEAPSTVAPSPQKNKKRCFTCNCKLELAQRTIGRCRCDRVFCGLHRLPELHHCDFDHKEDGRREAREKMVKPTRHLGTSFRSDDKL